jgi:hypothetical protein
MSPLLGEARLTSARTAMAGAEARMREGKLMSGKAGPPRTLTLCSSTSRFSSSSGSLLCASATSLRLCTPHKYFLKIYFIIHVYKHICTNYI